MSDQKKIILIVDDSKISLEVMARSLSEYYEVIKANSPQEAIDALQNNYVDLVLSDYHMPDKTGLELFNEIDEKFPAVGKILITAYSSLDAVEEAVNNRAVDKCLKKPWKKEDHLPIIQESLKNLDRQKQEAQMAHNAKLVSLGELSAGIVHELNNPLTFIDANLRNLSKFTNKIIGLLESYDELNVQDEIKEEIKKKKEEVNYDYLKNRIGEMIDKSRVGSDRMKKIMTDMKSISRQASFKLEEADINESLDMTLSILVHEYKNKAEIIKEYGNLPPVRCNIGKLSQVFMNLLVNACHAIQEKGEIKVKTFTEDEMCVIQISDTGTGIPESFQKKIFESFFTTKAVGKGTGLGLAISLRIIKQHRGKISLDSKTGEGTTFTIKIPLKLDAEDLDDKG